MSRLKPCQCGHLAQHAKDPRVPFVYHPDSDSYSLRLSPTVVVCNAKCPFCGGHTGAILPYAPLCRCGALSEWERDPAVPVEYGQLSRHLYGLHCDKGVIGLWFCPACGDRAADGHAIRTGRRLFN